MGDDAYAVRFSSARVFWERIKRVSDKTVRGRRRNCSRKSHNDKLAKRTDLRRSVVTQNRKWRRALGERAEKYSQQHDYSRSNSQTIGLIDETSRGV